MPTYDFRCRTCDAAFEVTRSIIDMTAPACPSGHRDSSRVFTPVAVGRALDEPAGQGGCCGGGCCG